MWPFARKANPTRDLRIEPIVHAWAFGGDVGERPSGYAVTEHFPQVSGSWKGSIAIKLLGQYATREEAETARAAMQIRS
jgi:hypothetical protein